MKSDIIKLKKSYLQYLDVHDSFQLTDDEVDNLIYNLKWSYPLAKSRGIYNMGTTYDFANIRVVGNEFDNAVLRLMNHINETYNLKLNSCLLNYYEDGNVIIGHHSDNCYNLKGGYANAIVVSVSYYSTRTMEFVSKDRREKIQIDLDHGDVLLMGEACQQHYLHGITKSKKRTGHRINLTFREFII